MRKLFTSMMLLCGVIAANAYEVGEYVYSSTAKYKIASTANKMPNATFSVVDITSADFGWKGGSVADAPNINSANITMAEGAGPNGETALKIDTQNSADTLFCAVPVSKNTGYVISYKVKAGIDASTGAPADPFTSRVIVTNSGLMDVFFNTTGNASKVATTDGVGDGYVQIGEINLVTNEWKTVTYTFTEVNSTDGYIVFNFANLPAGVEITDFQIVEAAMVPDTRPLEAAVAHAEMLLARPEFAAQTEGRDNLETMVGNVKGILSGEYSAEVLEDAGLISAFLDDSDEADPSASIYAAQEAFLDEYSSDALAYINYGDISTWQKFNNGDGWTSVGDWVFTGGATRWGHAAGADEGNYLYQYNNKLPWGQVQIAKAGMEAATYMFSLDAMAYAMTRAKNSTGGNDNYAWNLTASPNDGTKIFINNDTVDCGVLTTEYQTFTVFGKVNEGDSLYAGMYFAGFPDNPGSFKFRNAVLRAVGITAAQLERKAFVESIAVQQNALLDRINQGNELVANVWPWGKQAYRDSIALAQQDYDASLTYVDAEGNDLGVDIPEAYDDSLLQAVRNMNTARNNYTNLNVPYVDLVNYIPVAQTTFDDERNAAAPAAIREAFKTQITEATNMINTVTEPADETERETLIESFITKLADLKASEAEFINSCVNYLNPVEIEIINNSFQQGNATGWDATGQTDNGRWKYSTDTNFADGYAITCWRGNTAFSKNKVLQKVTISKAGVYKFICQAYAFNEVQSKQDAMWNGLSGEDSLHLSGIAIFFGPEDEPDSIANVCTPANDFVPRYFSILYEKQTEGDEVVEFGIDALMNGEPTGTGCNTYRFGSCHIYYYGTKEIYETGLQNAIAEEKLDVAAPVYNLAGVKVAASKAANLPKGLYISNGKKFVIK